MADVSDDYPAAAHAVMYAFTRGNPVLISDSVYRDVCAAALRVAVEQCVYTDDLGWEHMDPEDVLAIADELEAGAAT
jgi:hypothetical protein